VDRVLSWWTSRPGTQPAESAELAASSAGRRASGGEALGAGKHRQPFGGPHLRGSYRAYPGRLDEIPEAVRGSAVISRMNDDPQAGPSAVVTCRSEDSGGPSSRPGRPGGAAVVQFELLAVATIGGYPAAVAAIARVRQRWAPVLEDLLMCRGVSSWRSCSPARRRPAPASCRTGAAGPGDERRPPAPGRGSH
jgi:hypothetical protein